MHLPSPDVDHHEGQRSSEEAHGEERGRPEHERRAEEQEPHEVSRPAPEVPLLEQPAISYLGYAGFRYYMGKVWWGQRRTNTSRSLELYRSTR